MTLGHNSYGKAEIHLVHLDRAQEPHRVTDLMVTLALEGDFDATHLEGDNTATALATVASLVTAVVDGTCPLP